MTDTASAAPSEREQFEAHVKAYTGRDIEYHQRNGTTGLEFGWACWQAARAQPTASRRRTAMTEPTDAGPSPCPFCGSSKVVHYEVEGRANHHFECCECLATSMCKTTHQEALAAWNRRAPQSTKPQAGAVPLTDEQIQDAILPINPHGMGYFLRIARAIEAAHGIGIKGGQHGIE